jgi:phage-related tail fiber protein
MSTFGGISFTAKGRELMAKSQTGVKLNFTKISVGDGILNQSIDNLDSLISPIKDLTITKLKTMTGGKATIGGVLTNQNIITGFYWKELGLFAQDPDLGEILYCYGNAGNLAEYIPPAGGADILEKQINIIALIGNAESVTAVIDESLVYATQEYVNDAIGNIPKWSLSEVAPSGSQVNDLWFKIL